MQSEACSLQKRPFGRLLRWRIRATAATFSQRADQNKGPLAQKNTLQWDNTSIRLLHSGPEILWLLDLSLWCHRGAVPASAVGKTQYPCDRGAPAEANYQAGKKAKIHSLYKRKIIIWSISNIKERLMLASQTSLTFSVICSYSKTNERMLGQTPGWKKRSLLRSAINPEPLRNGMCRPQKLLRSWSFFRMPLPHEG